MATKTGSFDAWAAGLIDGEGCIGISKVKTGKGAIYSIRVDVGMSLPGLSAMNALRGEFGGQVAPSRQGTEKWAASFRWNINGAGAAKMLARVAPYLHIKSQHASLALDLQILVESLPMVKVRRKWTPDAIVAGEAMHQRMTELNRKGRNLDGAIAVRVGNRWMKPERSLFGEQFSDEFSMTLPKSGSMRNGVLYLRKRSEHGTNAIGFSCWPSADAQAMNDGTTPEAWERFCRLSKEKHGNGNGHGTTLGIAVQQFPEPPENWTTAQAHDSHARESGNRENPDGGNACLAWDAMEFPTAPSNLEARPTITTGDADSRQTEPNPNRQGGADHESLRVSAAQFPPSPMATVQAADDGHKVTTNPDTGRAMLWPSIDCNTSTYSNGMRGPNLRESATAFPPELWATAAARDFRTPGDEEFYQRRIEESARGQPLTEHAAMFPPEPWATSTARDADKCSGPRRDGDKTLTDDAKPFPSSPPPETTTSAGYGYSALIRLLCRLFGVQTEAEFRAVPKQLNPRFVCFLMGWPLHWTLPDHAIDTAPINFGLPGTELSGKPPLKRS